jgi:diaminopimelate decarboxylase
VRILYAIKANNTLAIRAILSSEGAGGDCFGLAELHATLTAGMVPEPIVMNGSNKSADEIAAAVAAGVTINVDAEDELDFLADALRAGGTARVNLRLKVLPDALDAYVHPMQQTEAGFVAGVRRVKWGFLAERTADLTRRLRAMPGVEMLGYSCHIGHLSSDPRAFAAVAGAVGAMVRDLAEATGFVPAVLDLGGGWPPERDPSFRREARAAATIETIAQATAAALRAALPATMKLPALWIEPGRFIVSNAVVLLARAGAVKRDAGYCWMHVDASTNDLPRIESGRFHYTILPASRMRDRADVAVEVVGSTCFRSVLGAGRMLPDPRRGDVVAILDTGGYAEVFANQFNAVPRPATILLSSHGAELVKARETIEDVFRRHRIPAWIAAEPAPP